MSLYNKYRPNDWDEIIGNKETIESLKNKMSKKEHPHVYMFTGNPGTGKTTTARIMANKLDSKNIIEINCANETGVDTAREIIESSRYKSLKGGNTVFILDEIHMSSKNFQNALLKPFEDTPSHVYYFLCTTDPQKIIPTIKSRATTYTFSPPNTREMLLLLKDICKKEEKDISLEVIRAILKNTSNHPRASINKLEKVMDVEGEEEQLKIIESDDANEKQLNELCMALLNHKKWDEVSKILKDVEGEPESLRYGILGYLSSGLMNGWTDKFCKREHVFRLMECFEYNFYDTKRNGLNMACYRGCNL